MPPSIFISDLIVFLIVICLLVMAIDKVFNLVLGKRIIGTILRLVGVKLDQKIEKMDQDIQDRMK